MKEEYRALGKSIETDEIRETYDLDTFRSNINYLPQNQTQTTHKHFLVIDAIHVMAGEIEVLHDKTWETVRAGNVAVFDLNELHNLRTLENRGLIEYPGATSTTTAVAIVYKWIPPYLKIHKQEISLIIQNDWFSDEFVNDLSDPSTSPILRLEKPLRDKYWSIIKRNTIKR
jgi:quercetin dioxygenase-like cupin family protein